MPEEVTNHSDVVETPVSEPIVTEPTNTEPVTAEPPVTTQETVEEPRGIKVKYNKEERFVPEDEVPTWVQKGLNYDKVQERATQADTYQQNLDRIAKYYGFETHDAYMEALDQAEREKLIQAEAEKYGVPEDFIRQELAPLKSEIETLRQERERLQRQESARQVEAEIASLKTKYPDFEQYQEKVFDMVVKGEVGSLETAYRLASYDDKMAASVKQKEQEVLANVTKRGEKQVLPSNDGASNTQFSVQNASMADIAELSRRARNGERIVL